MIIIRSVAQAIKFDPLSIISVCVNKNMAMWILSWEFARNTKLTRDQTNISMFTRGVLMVKYGTMDNVSAPLENNWINMETVLLSTLINAMEPIKWLPMDNVSVNPIISEF